jgi:taurine transport system substrate-binding protein
MRIGRLAALVAAATVTLAGCAVDHSGKDAGKPTIRVGYQSFPSGDLIVKNNKVAFVLDVAGDNEALVARNGTGINTIADLKGKRVATPFASTAHYSLLAALAQNGLSPKDVQLIDLQPQAILAAWDRGDIAAAYTWLPTLDQLRKTGKDLLTSRQLATDGKPTLDLATVSDQFAAAHPDVVDVWRQQEARALNVIKDDPAAAAKAIAAEVGLSPDDVAGQLKQGVYLTPGGRLTGMAWYRG